MIDFGQWLTAVHTTRISGTFYHITVEQLTLTEFWKGRFGGWVDPAGICNIMGCIVFGINYASTTECSRKLVIVRSNRGEKKELRKRTHLYSVS